MLIIACAGSQSPVEPSGGQEVSAGEEPSVGEEASAGQTASVNPEELAAAEELLGSPCLSDRPTPEGHAASSAIWKQYSAAMKSGNTADGIELRKQLIRYQCANEHLWFQLATLQEQTGNRSDAIAVLDHLHGRGSNEVSLRLRSQNDPLHALLDAPEFQGSELARKLAADRQQFEERLEEFRKKLAALPADQKPARNYVAKDVCPFECCTYRTWDVLADSILYDQPKSDKVAGRITKGEKVEALTGEVHLQPAPVGVLATPPESNVPPGSIVFVLDNMGEGYAHVWHKGEILDLGVYLGVREQCTFPGGEDGCWGEWLDRIEPSQIWPPSVWWVQIRTRGGVTGWTIVQDNFGNMDGCG